ncbi:F-box protein At5g51380-like [Punica granatum]|uniref:F-box protein At5g51380-like n=1 Tax=Punica granatum TaxID=22663 RepID=A0A6P8DF50_PUNGR|nr:F-box protein At5g51380-like [Punica granatum]
MPFRPQKTSPNPNPSPAPSPNKRRTTSWSDLWVKSPKSLNQVLFTMQLQSLPKDPKSQTLAPNFSNVDRTLLLPDDTLLRILSKLPDSQRLSNSLVCKRWLSLQGRLFSSLKVLDWGFIESGRLIERFPNLTHVDLSRACIISPQNSSILLHHGNISMHLSTGFSPICRILDENLLSVDVVDRGLRLLAGGCPNLCKLVVIGASEMGLMSVAEECLTLQELELHRCNDNVLRGIAGCRNLQILKLVGCVEGLYSELVSDIGLTILAQGCKRLVRLELSGCEGSFDGIKAIGQCCQMLEELTLCDHRMDGGWLAGLSYCENLKTLKLQACRAIDSNPGPDEYLGSCPALESLHLEKCQLRDKQSVRAMFLVCQAVKDVVIQDCWGLEDEIFSLAIFCRRVRFVSLEGCSLLTTQGLESVVISWKELQSLRVMSCKSIKDSEISPDLATLFSVLKDLKWRPDTKSLLAASLAGTGMGRKGGRFFKRT